MIDIPIKPNRLIALFQQLVSLDSPSYGERHVGDFLIEKLTALDAAPLEDNAASRIGGNCGNLYARIEGEESLAPLLFCAHMDTVEPSRGKKMQLLDDGTITSDGTTVLGADDAAAIAAILEALTTLHENNISHRPIELLFTVAEEPYCVGVREFNVSQLLSKEAYVFDLNGEMGNAAIQAPTILSFTIKFSGCSAHAGFAPEAGIHAIHAAAHAITQIPTGRIGDSTVNVGTISGGTANNIVPDSCVFTGEIRSYTDAHAVELFHQIEEIVQNAAKKFQASADVQMKRHVTAYRVNPDAPVIKRYIHACEQLGLNASLCATFGGSDNNHLVQHGIQGIVPATAMFQCHTCQEYTTVPDLITAAKLAYSLMTSKE